MIAIGFDQSQVAKSLHDYGRFASLADLFRQIGYDERVHKLESLARLDVARFE